MPPSYPNPPNPAAPIPAPVQLRRLIGRGLAAVLARQPDHCPEPERILLVRPDHLGDLLFLGPALRWLRAERPHAQLTLLIGPWGRPALPALDGCYDHLIVAPLPGFERGERADLLTRWRALPRMAGELRERNFEAALIFRPDHWWGAMLAGLAGVPRRLGYDTPETTPWLTEALPLPHEHTAASNLRLAGRLIGLTPAFDPAAQPLSFALSLADRQMAAAMLAAQGVGPAQKVVVISAGAGADIKLWESEKWGEVARRLSEQDGVIILTGGPDEQALAAEIAASAGGVINLAGQTNFGQLAALLARADVVLGPDSGPLNLAVAVGTPTVHLFGPADPLIFGPWGASNRHIVLRSQWTCAGCGRFDWPDLPAHGCVRDISVAAVVAAAATTVR